MELGVGGGEPLGVEEVVALDVLVGGLGEHPELVDDDHQPGQRLAMSADLNQMHLIEPASGRVL